MRISLSDWQSFSDSLITSGTPFTVQRTTFTMLFDTPYGEYEYIERKRSNIPAKELNFIKQVKEYCTGLDLNFSVDREQIKYIDIPNKRSNYRIENCFEIDLSSAYWFAAKELNIISEELYNKGQQISKPTRLAALGALAKQTYFLEFNGREFIPAKMIEGEKANFFYRCSEYISEIMQVLKFVAGNDYLFYWCDAIFLTANGVKLVKEYLELNNLKYSLYNIDSVERQKEKIIVTSEHYKKEKGREKREFTLQKNNFELFDKIHLK